MAGKPTSETTPSSPARGVGALDRVAERLAAEAGVELGVADSPSDLIAAHRLRHRVASERDAYDTRALQICAWDGDTLVGTLRLVLPMPGKRLPVEEAFDLAVEPAGEVVDVGPAVVAPGLGSERARQVADGLVAQAWFETRARGYLVMAAIASSRLAERYRALGLDVEVIGRLGDRNALRLDPSIG